MCNVSEVFLLHIKHGTYIYYLFQIYNPNELVIYVF